MQKFVQWWLACVVVFVLLIGAASAIGQAKGGAMFAFTSRGGEQIEIYLMDVERGIAHLHSLGLQPTLSRDGVLAFTNGDTLHIEDGHSTTVVETPPSLLSPKWSPDGTQIAFIARSDHDFWNIYTWHRYSQETVQLTNQTSHVIRFEWSPNSIQIAFIDSSTHSANSNDVIGIHILEVESGDIRTIADVRPIADRLAWSPDGTRLAFSVLQDTRNDIVIWDSRDNTIQTLVQNAADVAWSPDGEWLAYTVLDYYGADIFTIHIASGVVHNLTNSSLSERLPNWSPDGEWLAYLCTDGVDVCIIHVTSGEIRNLTNSPRLLDGALSWRPVGTYSVIQDGGHGG